MKGRAAEITDGPDAEDCRDASGRCPEDVKTGGCVRIRNASVPLEGALLC